MVTQTEKTHADNSRSELISRKAPKKPVECGQVDGELSEKPRYGFTALKYYLNLAIIGLIGLTLVLFGIFSKSSARFVLIAFGFPVALIGLWIGLSYVPLYFGMLRPRVFPDHWADIFMSEEFRGNEQGLDVGCGTGGVAIRVAKALPKGRIMGIDIYEGVSGRSPDQAARNACLEGVGDRVEFRHGNLLEIPFPDHTFDVVTAGSVLHEIHEETAKLAALEEIYRVLKPGGIFATIEILRDARLWAFSLFFALVWSPIEYWKSLFKGSQFQLDRVEVHRKVLDYGLFILRKPRNPS